MQDTLIAHRRDVSPDVSPDVSVVIVNYNSGPYLEDCLRALQRASDSLHVQTIVVDNGSTDSSVGLLEAAEREGLTVIRAGKNLGFGRANNLGASVARGECYLLLNTDCFLRPGALERLFAAMKEGRRVAVAGPRLLNADGTLQPSCHNFPTPLVLFLEQTLLWKLLTAFPLVREWLLIASPHDREREVEWLAGACLLVSAEAYSQVGGFDERFFFYWEETDLCLRLREAGWKTRFVPGAEAVHLGGGSSTNLDLLLQFFKSLYLFYRKHYGPGRTLAARGIIRGMSLVKALRAAIAGRRSRDLALRRQLYREQATWLRVARR